MMLVRAIKITGTGMPTILQKFYRAFSLFIMVVVLQACGGSSDNSPKYTISTNISSAHFNNEQAVANDNTFTIDVKFSGTGMALGFAPGATIPPWLEMRTENVTATSASVVVSIVNADRFIANLYETVIRVSTADKDGANLVSADVDVSLLIWQALDFSETLGISAVDSQTYQFNNNGNWQVTTDVDWLSAETTTTDGISTVTVTADPSVINQAGLNQSSLILTNSKNAQVQNVPVNFALDNLYLYSSEPTVAFTSTANIKALSQTVNIKTNATSAVEWQASANVDWLTVTADNNNNTLAIVAEPASLTNESAHKATVTLSAVDNANVIGQTIDINLYKSALSVDNSTIDDISVNGTALILAPHEPHIYAGISHQIKVFHQYTGAELLAIDVAPEGILPENFLVNSLVVHPEGKQLLVRATETIPSEDPEVEDETKAHRFKVMLNDYSVTAIEDATTEAEPAFYVSFYGRHFVLTQLMELADDNLQRLWIDPANVFFARQASQASQQDTLFVLNGNTSTINRLTAKVNDFGALTVTTSKTHDYRPETLAEGDVVSDFVVNNDASQFYLVSPTSEWLSFDGETFTDNGLLELNEDENIVTFAVEKSSNGRAFFTRFEPTTGFYINGYNSDSVLSSTIPMAGFQSFGFEISQDDKRVISNARSNEKIELVNLTQFDLALDKLAFSTNFGDAVVTEQRIAVTGAGEGWTATSDQEWLLVTQDLSGETPELVVNIDSTKISGWGLFTAKVTVTDPASGSTRIIEVTIAVDAIRLSSSTPALAFNQAATQSVLSHTIKVLHNSESALAWSATTDAPWLTLTPNATNNTLTLTANPAMASGNGSCEATVTLASNTDGAALPGTISVMLTNSATDATDVTVNNVVANNNANSQTPAIAVDKYRPYVYVAQGDDIIVYNALTGTEQSSIASPLNGVNLDYLVLHPDGSSLFASNLETYTDDNGDPQQRVNHYQVNLATMAITQLDSEVVDINYRPIAIEIIDGLPVVLTQGLELANLSFEVQSWDQANSYFVSTFGHANASSSLTIQNTANTALDKFDISVNAYAEQTISSETSSSFVDPAFGSTLSAIALDGAGGNIYTASSAVEWSTFDGSTYTKQGLLDNGANITPSSVFVDAEDNSYFYRFDQSAGYVATKYDTNQMQVWQQTIRADGTSQSSYFMPSYQKVIAYDAFNDRLHFISVAP